MERVRVRHGTGASGHAPVWHQRHPLFLAERPALPGAVLNEGVEGVTRVGSVDTFRHLLMQYIHGAPTCLESIGAGPCPRPLVDVIFSISGTLARRGLAGVSHCCNPYLSVRGQLPDLGHPLGYTERRVAADFADPAHSALRVSGLKSGERAGK